MAQYALNKDEASKLQDFITRLTEYKEQFEAEGKKTDRQSALKLYCETLKEASDFVEETASYWRGVWDDRSEGWQESDRGQEVDEFIQTWEDAGNELSEPDPKDLDQELEEDAEVLEGLDVSA